MTSQVSAKHPRCHKFFILFLYALPIVFSFFTAFLITASGEDIFQGAGNLANGGNIDVAGDASAAFALSSRITDMYAWPVIDFYDYQFSFGPDIIFRLIDVAMLSAVFYFSTYLILGRKPKLRLKDALVFCSVFTAFIITPFGYTFYREFSMIHNYVPLALVTLVFCIPYIWLITGRQVSKRFPLLKSVGMCGLGVIFGMSATITPIAFLATVVIFAIVRRKQLTKPPLWALFGCIGTIVGFLVCWLAGSGVDHYTSTSATAAVFDYIPLSGIITHIPTVFSHVVYNFALVLIPLMAVVGICLVFTKNPKQIFARKHLSHLSAPTTNIVIVFAVFIIVHILGATLVKAPPRLLIPAYLAGVIVVFRLLLPHLRLSTIFTTAIALATFAAVTVHGVLLIKYHLEMAQVLEAIKQSDETTICISPEDTKPTRIPLIDLSQANMLVDWNMPEPIYDKQIITCK